MTDTEVRMFEFKISYFNRDGSWHGSDVFGLELPIDKDQNARSNMVAAAEHVIGIRDGTVPGAVSVALDLTGRWDGFILLDGKEHNDGMPLLLLPYESFEDLIKRLRDLPDTWYPAVLKEIVQESYSRPVWRPGGATRFIQHIERMQEEKAKEGPSERTPLATERTDDKKRVKAKLALYFELFKLPTDIMSPGDVDLMYQLCRDPQLQDAVEAITGRSDVQ